MTMRGNSLFWCGAALTGISVALTVVGLFYTPYPPNEMQFGSRLLPPSIAHPFGTDQFGRDMLSRVMAGGAASLSLGLFAPLTALALSLPIALIAGFRRGMVGNAIIRVVDAVLAMPTLVLALLVIVTLGPGLLNAIVALGIAMTPKFTRVAYAAVVEVAANEYIEAAVARGEKAGYVLFKEILPNMWGPILVEVSVYVGFGLMAGASLSYLGLGTQPPNEDWGRLIREAWSNIGGSYWLMVGPSTLLVSAIVGVNLLGDGLRSLATTDEHGR